MAKKHYQPPQILHKGKLKQFSGSVLGVDPNHMPGNPLRLPPSGK